MDAQQANAWLSEERFEPFLRASAHDHNRAVVLYQWHEELSAAVFSVVHRLEVLLRNSIDGTLGDGQPQAPLNETWLFDLSMLRPVAMRQVIVAVERLGRGAPVTRAGVVAGLSLGFWVALFDRSYEELWRTRLHRAFPHEHLARQQVGERLRNVQRLRNRIAHHDCLLDQDVEARFGDMLALAGWVDPAAPAWLRRAAEVERALARRP